MSYYHAGMPPVLRITAENTADGTIDWQLESQDGTVIQTYTTNGIDHPDSWWDDVVAALLADQSVGKTAHDMIRLNAFRNWDVIDEA